MPPQYSEKELKLLARDGFQLPDLTGRAGVSAVRPLEAENLSARYYDTTDFRLLANEITFRRRTGEHGGPKWTLKLPAGREDMRTEVEFPGGGTTPPAEALEVLFGITGGRPLEPIAGIKTNRNRAVLVSDDGVEIAQLLDDRVTIRNGTKTAGKFREIEIEAVDGSDPELARIARAISNAGAKPEQRAKFSRAVEALYGDAPIAESPPLPGPNDAATSAVRPMLAATLRRLLASDPHTRLGEPEGVHQLRVSGRRMRSVIRTFGPLLREGKASPVIEDLRWLGTVAGAIRDLDVMTAALHAEDGDLVPAAVLEELSAQRSAAFSELLKALRSGRYLAFIDRVNALIADEALTVEDPGTCEEVFPPLVDAAWRKLRKAAQKLSAESPPQEYHRVRILAKRARYAGESVGQFTKTQERKRLSRLAAYAESLQNVLGEQQDALFAITRLQQLAAEKPQAGSLNLALGRLIERQNQKAERRALDFLAMWQKLERKRAA